MRLYSRVLALESRLFDSLSAGNASQSFDGEKLDLAKMQQLERHETLMHALDTWVLIPDKNVRESLTKLSALTRELYQFPKSLTLYRGFDLQSPYQNTMGLSRKGLLHNEVKKGLLRGSLHHWSDDRPISWTTDPQIARAFGKVVVSTEVNPNQPGTLVITPELAALVCKRRNIDLETQHEVILLPPVDVEFVLESHRE